MLSAIAGAFSEDRSIMKKCADRLAQIAAGETCDEEAEADRNRREHVAAITRSKQ